MNVALWIVQGLLALVLFSDGGMRLMSIPGLRDLVPFWWPDWVWPFVGAAEVLVALCLILPRLLRIRPGLTPLAAAGLAIVMVVATWGNNARGDIVSVRNSLVVGLLAAFVAYGRWRPAAHPQPPDSRSAG